MFIDENTVLDLRPQIKDYMTESRFAHSLSVEHECEVIGKISKMTYENTLLLRISALLHDIAKEMTADEQIKLLNESNVEFDTDCLSSPEILHQYTAIALIRRDFSQFDTEKITSPILSHSTGKPDMSLSEKILYIADIIEQKRRNVFCRKIREYYYNRQGENNSLDSTLLLCLSGSISHLLKRRNHIAGLTVDAYNYYIAQGKSSI